MKRIRGLRTRLEKTWLVRGVRRGLRHGAVTYSAALAFYAVLSLPGMVLVASSVAGFSLGEELTQSRFLADLRRLAGPEAAEAARSVTEHLATSQYGVYATIAGLLVLLFAATGFFVQLQEALNVVWTGGEVDPSGFSSRLESRLLSFVLVLAMGALLVVYIASGLVVESLSEIVSTRLAVPAWSLRIVDSLLTLAFVFTFFTLVYRLLPDTTVAWSEAARGAATSAVLFLVGRSLISLWVERGGIASVYEAGGAVVVLLLWLYYSSLLLLLGAEVSRMAAEERAARRRSS